MNLYQKYGYCTVPTGTILYRSGSPQDLNSYMFFGLTQCVAEEFKTTSNELQIWETQKETKVLFMVSHVYLLGGVKSSITDIYNHFVPDDIQQNPLDIKQTSFKKRDRLVKKFKKQDIIGWLTSLEDKRELELCYFLKPSEFEKTFKLINTYQDSLPTCNCDNSLHKLDICPGEEFYTLSQNEFGSEDFRDYQIYVNRLITEQVKKGKNQEQATNHCFDLRVKLHF